ncbi:hypothetical protein JTB14_000732 [Gonioctena quinquepunctata]|nr:hypothetical protein JTB14_000732 [Gonioctena quinquepunctata]
MVKCQIYQNWLNLRYKYLALAPEVKHLLKSLRGNYLLALITNGPSNAQWEKVEKLNLKQFFDLILVSADLPWEKPHPKIFEEACHTLCVEPHQSIIVGDKLETDILGGIASKLGGTVWVPLGGQQLRQTDPLPDYVVDNVTDLFGLLPQISKVMKKKGTNSLSLRLNNVSLSDVDDCNSNGSDAS